MAELRVDQLPVAEKISGEDIRTLVVLGMRNEMRRMEENPLPILVDWGELGDGEKLERMRLLLDRPLWQLLQIGDDRTASLPHNQLVNPYQGSIMPWMETVLKEQGDARVFHERILAGKFDDMIWEMGREGKLLPGQAATEEYLGLGSSTGEAPSLRQYYEALEVKIQLEEIVKKASSWGEAREKMAAVQEQQRDKLRQIYQLPEGTKIAFTQSGTEAELLLALFGVKASQFHDESGSATKNALAGNHPSKSCWTGLKNLAGKILGLESIRQPKEIKLRDEQGKVKDSAKIKGEVEDWIKAEQAKQPNDRLALHIIAGSKSGIAHQGRGAVAIGGLTLEDAITLRQQYGQKAGSEIIIVVDMAQNRAEWREASRLLGHNVLVNITGSKFPGGPMFSHAMLIPPLLAEMMQSWVKANNIPEGLKNYLVQGDLAEVLGKDLTSQLFDMPDPGILKWAAPLPTMAEFAALENNPKTHAELLSLEIDLMEAVWRHLNLASNRSSAAKKWQCIRLKRGEKAGRESLGLQALEGFYVEINGRRLSVAEIKELHRYLADFQQGQGIHLGQAVEIDTATQESILRLAPSQEFLLRYYWENQRGNGYRFKEQLGQAIAAKMALVLESKFITATPLLASLTDKTKSGLWSLWVRNNNQIVDEVMRKCTTVEEKLRLTIGVMAQMWREGKSAPVIVMSGKNVAVLEVAHLAWEEAGLDQELAVAFVDHPYVSRETRLNLRAALMRYPETHLYVFAASEEMQELAVNDEFLQGRVTVISQEPKLHDIIRVRPNWRQELMITSPEQFNSLSKEKFAENRRIAKTLNEYYKAQPTRKMIDYFKHKFNQVPAVFLRGNARRHANRQEQPFLQLPRSNSFINLYPLYDLTEAEMKQMAINHHIDWLDLTDEGYGDSFKDVADSLQCGLDQTFITD